MLAAWVRGWPGKAPRTGGGIAPEQLLARLLSIGVITSSREAGKSARADRVLPATVGLIEHYFDPDVSVKPADVFGFIACTSLARMLLRFRTFEQLGARLALRRRHSILDVSTARLRVRAFDRLRPLRFRTRNMCLLDSLSLSEFLAGSGLFPNWVFGVRTEPFAAHCWLQQDGFVFNETPDIVARFTPVMAL